MQLRIFQVDAFTSRRFGGNPAAVVPLEAEWPNDALLQAIAAENNLSETAFLAPEGPPGDVWRLRWFTPTVEVDLCGHATLASAHVLLRHRAATGELRFASRSGPLGVREDGERLVLDFPASKLARLGDSEREELAGALGARPAEAWRVDEAMRAMRDLQQFDLVWLEEPISPDNFEGYRHLRAYGGVPLAAGENLHTLAEFATLIGMGGVDHPEPDLTTCGGYTPFLKVARLAEAHGLPVMSHGAHDLHIHCLAASPNATYLEWHMFGLDKFMADPLAVKDGYAAAPERPGHGVDFDWDQLNAHRV